MFGKSFRIFKLFGFDIKIDLSWVIIAGLITWSLATGLFPSYYHSLSKQDFWIMGIAGAVGLFASIIFHEVSHSIVARKYGIPIQSITLFLFGGVASISEEPKSAKIEFLMAIAGPLTSIVLGFIFFLIRLAGKAAGLTDVFTGIFGYLALINWVLAGFNLVPAFPLDGGRVFRAALWKWMKNQRKATRVASAVGSGFGILLILLGIVQLFFGYFINGIWWFIIGFFLYNTARSSYQRVLLNDILAGEKVKQVMTRDIVTVSPDITVLDLVENYIYKYHHKMFPVVENGILEGSVTTADVRNIQRPEWTTRTVRDLLKESSRLSIGPEDEVLEAMSRMNRQGLSRLMVADEGGLAGIISLKDIMRALSVKMELKT